MSDLEDLSTMNEAMFGEAFGSVLAEIDSEEPVDQPWRVESDDQAEWALQRLALANEERRRLREQADDWAARIQVWFEQAAQKHQRTADFMTERLENYALRLRAAGTPSLALPSGTLRTTETKPTVKVEDEVGLADWLERNAALWRDEFYADGMLDQEAWETLVKRTPKVYLTPLRKLVKVGQVSEGVWATSTLACGHQVEQQVESLGDSDVPSRGDMLPCGQCPLDLLDQAPPYVAVEVTIVQERFRATVVGPDGSEVPGASVDPGGVSVSVKAR